jgi:hypothetical protein
MVMVYSYLQVSPESALTDGPCGHNTRFAKKRKYYLQKILFIVDCSCRGRSPAALAGRPGDQERFMINVTFKFVDAKKIPSAVIVKLDGSDDFEWRLADQPHPEQPAGCLTIWHWCSGSYRWVDAAVVDKALQERMQ